MWQPLPKHLEIVFFEITFFPVIVHGITAGLFENEQGDAACHQFTYLIIASFAMVLQIVDLHKKLWKIMADSFVNLPYNDLAVLAGGGLGA